MTTIALDELMEAWHTNNRVNLMLIDRNSDEGMAATLSTRGGRDVVRQFAHLHNVRAWHAQHRAKALARSLVLFDTYERPARTRLKAALSASATAVQKLLRAIRDGQPGVRGFKKGPVQMLAYFIAHESHHRGNILLTLKQCGHNLDQRARYAIWDWDRL